ncbi:MAG TPA: hypothetical protein VGJ41_13930 [Nocardioides sp.]|jgi:hypothetical protein
MIEGKLAMSVVSVAVGAGLSALAIFMGVTALTPDAKQSDAPLIVYGND